MKKPLIPVCLALSTVAQADLTAPVTSADTIFGARDGRIAVEAEHFFAQEKAEPRAWYHTHDDLTPGILPDGDPNSANAASGAAYLEILPDTRRNHGDKLVTGENFQPKPGLQAILSYKVRIDEPGRYYVWVRAFSTNTEDNGIHVGINGTWPESGQRMQWNEGKNYWRWDSKQRTAQVHTGVEGKIWLDIDKAGDHTIQFSMREDGFEFDKFMLTRKQGDRPDSAGPAYKVVAGPEPGPLPTAAPSRSLSARDFKTDAKGQYIDQGKWLAVDPNQAQSHLGRTAFPLPGGKYDITLHTVGEHDGSSTYTVVVNGEQLGKYNPPLSVELFETGVKYNKTWPGVDIGEGDVIDVIAELGSADGKEYARARWQTITFTAADDATSAKMAKLGKVQEADDAKALEAKRRAGEPLYGERGADGDGSIEVTGNAVVSQPLTFTLDGPFAHELDKSPNPFTDYRLTGYFEHEESGENLVIPGYFAADGNAAETSAASGTKWRVHFAPTKPGKWTGTLWLKQKPNAIYPEPSQRTIVANVPLPEQVVEFEVAPLDENAPGFYSHGRLGYNGTRYLHFAGTGKPFFKVGADAPETLLAFADFDGTVAFKKNVKLKTFPDHVKDWQTGQPTWQGGKGKGLIGALSYLRGAGANAVSFLTYNAGGDGDNVWPFVDRRATFHYDCSKLDQWNIAFTHAQSLGLYLHFKLQETENDDRNRGNNTVGRNADVPCAMDGGDLGPERMLYLREMVARFGHHLALNWNVGEENTQSTAQQVAIADYIAMLDAYDNNIVIHSYPQQQEKVYRPLLGQKSYTGASLQNDWSATHRKTLQWLKESSEAGKIWVVANDEQGPADTGCPPDNGYKGFAGVKAEKRSWDMHDIRKQTLWGNLMAGGAGVEYYFGYKLPENDLHCQDWRSRHMAWTYGKHAIDFFNDSDIPWIELKNRNELVGNTNGWANGYCMASNKVAVVYLHNGGEKAFDFPAGKTIEWFNPRTGERTDAQPWTNGKLTAPDTNDWAAIIRS